MKYLFSLQSSWFHSFVRGHRAKQNSEFIHNHEVHLLLDVKRLGVGMFVSRTEVLSTAIMDLDIQNGWSTMSGS